MVVLSTSLPVAAGNYRVAKIQWPLSGGELGKSNGQVRPQPAVRGGRPISIANVSSGWVERQVFGSPIGIYTAPNPP